MKKHRKIRHSFALMTIVSLLSASTGLAYPTGKTLNSGESHDASYVMSVKNAGPVTDELVRNSSLDGSATKSLLHAETSGLVQSAESESTVPITTDVAAPIVEGDSESAKQLSTSVPLPAEQSDPIDGRPVAMLPPESGISMDADVLVVDNDAYKSQSQSKDESSKTSSWTEVRAEAGKSVITAGARFPIVLITAHTSRTGRVGDRVEGRLKSDIVIGDNLIAKKNSQVVGQISSAHKARRILIAQLAPKRWMRANGAIGIKFNELINHDGQHIPLVGAPARMARIIDNKAEGRVLGINHNGEIAAPLSTQLKNQGVQLALRGAAGAGGVFSMGAVPVIFGLIGAIHPSFAFLHPVGQNVPHRRLKGFGMGFLSGLPGGFLVADYILKGVEAQVKPGDEFLVEFRQDFDGQPATVAELQPQERMKVRAEVIRKKYKSSKSKKRALREEQ
ncbi:MAG: hypothetical protein K2X93_27430 [Candidatus Obscuribacterales bacterium]|nr:hypothetical protein [Candidatus Obscuribacterales bacterium]